MSYGDFGLDTQKRAQDPGQAGKLYCPWTQQAHAKGYSLCFNNWILSLVAALALLPTEPVSAAPGEQCFKCRRRNVALYPDKSGNIGICRMCVEHAVEYLSKPAANPDAAACLPAPVLSVAAVPKRYRPDPAYYDYREVACSACKAAAGGYCTQVVAEHVQDVAPHPERLQRAHSGWQQEETARYRRVLSDFLIGNPGPFAADVDAQAAHEGPARPGLVTLAGTIVTVHENKGGNWHGELLDPLFVMPARDRRRVRVRHLETGRITHQVAGTIRSALPEPTGARSTPVQKRYASRALVRRYATILLPPLLDRALRDGAALAISISGGKDSQALLYALVDLFRTNGYPGPLVVVHADLGRAEWHQTPAFVGGLAEEVGLDLLVTRRTKGDLVARIEERAEKLTGTGKPFWPSADNRYCTSHLKAGPIDTALRQPFWPSSDMRYCTSDLKRGPINTTLRSAAMPMVVISAEGVRADESRDRAKKPVYEIRRSITAASKVDPARNLAGMTPEEAYAARQPNQRLAFDWRPIFRWTEAEVWQACGTSVQELESRRVLAQAGQAEEALDGWVGHPAYALGNKRLSCALCVLATKNDLVNGANHNPDTYGLYLKLEVLTGCTFKHDQALADLPVTGRAAEVRQQILDQYGPAPIPATAPSCSVDPELKPEHAPAAPAALDVALQLLTPAFDFNAAQAEAAARARRIRVLQLSRQRNLNQSQG